jgi:hypothetical protein
MDEILKKLLESDLLSEETKTEISSSWAQAVEAKTAELKEEAILEVRSELAEQWVQERDALIEKVDAFVAEQLTTEIAELQGDIERFRDLEAEYAEKLVEEKQNLAEEVADELDQLVDKIDAFFEVRLAEEIEELKEDLDVVKQNDFGRRIFEAFVTEFSKSYVDEDSVQSKLTVAESKLQDAQKQVNTLEIEKNKMIREAKLQEILKPLTGGKREQMTFILQNVETARLEEAYKHFIGRVLKEEAAPAVAPVVAVESTAAVQVITEATTVVTGEEKIEPTPVADTAKSDALARQRKLAGIGN